MFHSLRDTLSAHVDGTAQATVGALMQHKIRPVLAGFLEKEGGVVKSWKRRYFILHRTQLFYYRENRKDAVPAGRVDLRGATVRTASKITGKPNSFEIRSADRTYYFVADSDKERQHWMLALHEATGTASTFEAERSDSSREDSREGSSQQEMSRTCEQMFVIYAAQWLMSTKGTRTSSSALGAWEKGLFCDAGLSHEVSAIRRQLASASRPLIPHSLFLRYVAVAEGHKTDSTRRRELQALMNDLPAVQRQMTQLLVSLLQETSSRGPDGGTPAGHLAVIFAPLIAPNMDLPSYFPQLACNTLLLINTDDDEDDAGDNRPASEGKSENS